jgi:hypothetical protein
MSPLAKICLPVFVALLAFSLWPSSETVYSYPKGSQGTGCGIPRSNLLIGCDNQPPVITTHQLHGAGGFYFLLDEFIPAYKPKRVHGLTYDINISKAVSFNALEALAAGAVAALVMIGVEKKFIPTVIPTWFRKDKTAKKKWKS